MHYETDEERVSARELQRAARKKQAEAAKAKRREEREKEKAEKAAAKKQEKAERAAELWGLVKRGISETSS